MAATGLVAVLFTTSAEAAAPKGAVPGRFTHGTLAKYDELAKYMKASKVWCAWRGDKVIVHINLKNTSAEHVTASIKPRYYIARGGQHGHTGFGKDYGFDAGEFRSLWIEHEPDGVKPRTRIARCAPYLFLIESG